MLKINWKVHWGNDGIRMNLWRNVILILPAVCKTVLKKQFCTWSAIYRRAPDITIYVSPVEFF